MEREVSVCVRDGANDGEAGVFVEEVVADDECGAAAFLFVAGLGVEGELRRQGRQTYKAWGAMSEANGTPGRSRKILCR